MKPIIDRLKYEPVLLLQVPTVVFATAAGFWESTALAFGAAVFAALGALFARAKVSPVSDD